MTYDACQGFEIGEANEPQAGGCALSCLVGTNSHHYIICLAWLNSYDFKVRASRDFVRNVSKLSDPASC